MKIKRLLPVIVLLMLTLVSCNKKTSERLTVIEDGKTDYNIILADSSKVLSECAERLQNIFGANAYVCDEDSAVTSKEILIGVTNRAESEKYANELSELVFEDAFHYVIAECNGIVVILSDDVRGYLYATDYIAENCVIDGDFAIDKGSVAIKAVKWKQYYASKYYEDELVYIEDQNRFEEEQTQLGDELGRYDQFGDESSAMTKGEVIEQYKKLAASFKDDDFGEYSAAIFTEAREHETGRKFEDPTIYPDESHPRVLFTKNSIGALMENLAAEENLAAFKKYMSQSDMPCDGKFASLQNSTTHNMDYNITSYIEAKAFRYAMTGDEIYGYQAIYCIKNAILTIDIPEGTLNDNTREWGWIMYTAACVYDWCYDLLTEADKRQIIAGCVNLIGKNMEIVRYAGVDNLAPTAQGPVYGHGGEAQLLRDWLSFAIACYDEAPEIYELVAGRILNDYTEAQNYYFESENHWEGASYSCGRTSFTLFGAFLFNRMTDGELDIFTDALEEVVVTVMHYIRPDGEVIRIGDVWQEGRNTYYDLDTHYKLAYFAGNYYGNSYLKSFAYDGLKGFGKFSYGNVCITPVMYLIFNDTDVPCDDDSELTLTRTTKYPYTSLFARSSRNDVNAFMVYMTMNEMYAASHTHMDCGSFQIYYNGSILASDSGKYSTWGDYHHMSYNMQTVSSNSILVYNPNLAGQTGAVRPNMVYSGGQSIKYERDSLPNTLENILNKQKVEQSTSLGAVSVERDGVYLYSYMGGDMTEAYDEETVDEVTRYMLSAATGDSKCPYVVIVFDRITSDNASYRKSALIHVQEEPTVTDDGFVVITNSTKGGTGKLVVQSVMSETEFTVIGGEGKEFWLYDSNAYTDTSNAPGTPAEYGWGRVEISPTSPSLTDYLLTVMYVTDTGNKADNVKAENISTDALAGSKIFNTAAFFPKNEKLLDEELSISTEGSGKIDYYIAGAIGGTWGIFNGSTQLFTVEVADGSNIISFEAEAGTYTLKPLD